MKNPNVVQALVVLALIAVPTASAALPPRVDRPADACIGASSTAMPVQVGDDLRGYWCLGVHLWHGTPDCVGWYHREPAGPRCNESFP